MILSYSIYVLALIVGADCGIDVYKAYTNYKYNEIRYEQAYKYKEKERKNLTFCKETQSFIKKNKCTEYSEKTPQGKNEN